MSRNKTALKKYDDELQIVWGEVYAPMIPDSQGDFMTADEIRKMAYDFAKSGQLANVDTNHDNQPNGSAIVETFIAREDDSVFIPGSWVVGVHVPDVAVWELVKSGELNGFSLEGLGLRKETTIQLDIPPEVRGATDTVNEHAHRFVVKFDAEGQFLGGTTEAADDGHTHRILRGTVTEVANDHVHRFSFAELINAHG